MKKLWALASIASLAGGSIALGIGAYHRDAETALLLDELPRAVSLTAEIERIESDASLGDEGNVRARRAIERAMKDARDVSEETAFRGALECLDGRECDGGLHDALAPARTLYSSFIERARRSSEATRGSSSIVLVAGAIACALGLLGFIALFQEQGEEDGGGRDRGRAGASADAAEPLGVRGAEPPNARPMEDLFRERLESLYEARARASESEHFAAYGEIAAALSHGLKTPLASIRAATQVAQLKLDAGHPARPFLDQIIDEVDGLVEQVRRFLSAAGPSASLPTRVEPARFLRVLEDAYATEARNRGLLWSAEAVGEVGEICVDPALLEMALRNLVENALAAAPTGTSISVVARACDAPERAGLESAPARHGAWMEFSVRDEGPGVPAEVLRGQAVASGKPSGSGLGIAIARRIVTRHGGALVFDVAPVGGTSVRIVLPMAGALASHTTSLAAGSGEGAVR